ncbi:MAG: NAD(+) diphosphatase [Methanobacterium sp. ERen5]|nr:MAG: NAD(+) diphosphatase [Methanobacterium sp. ERen5]
MKRESIYNRYKPLVKPESNNEEKSYWFIFKSDHMLINPKSSLKIPFHKDLNEINVIPQRKHYMGILNNKPCYVIEVDPGTQVRSGMEFLDLRTAYDILEEDIYLLAGRALQIMNWDKNHMFCGRCGVETMTMEDENAKFCPECGFTSYTRISPAVITAIVKEDKILMAKHSYGLKDRYALVAGFLEAGETLEEAVKREVMEEVGLEVEDIQYFDSQPWPFPNSLMIGFTAKYASGEIKVDGKEIVDAKWFDASEVSRFPSKISIASELVEWFLQTYHKS